MRIAELAQSIDPDMIERLPLSVAHRLAARNAPADVVSEVIAEVKAGEMPTGPMLRHASKTRAVGQAKSVPFLTLIA